METLEKTPGKKLNQKQTNKTTGKDPRWWSK